MPGPEEGPLYKRWREECLHGLECLVSARVATEHRPVGYRPDPTTPSEISLVGHQSDSGDWVVSFVHWRDTLPDLEGRICRVDATARSGPVLVYPTGVPVQRFTADMILHPAIGVSIRRAKGVLRTSIPKAALRLKGIWESVKGCGAVDALGLCVGCEDEHGPLVFVCGVCQLSWHPSRAERFFQSDVSVAKHEPAASVYSVPFEFKDAGPCILCDACRIYLSDIPGP
jgi:hypothetical protein